MKSACLMILAIAALALIAGCGTTGGTGTGYGADAGPWPSGPNRTAAAPAPPAEQAPPAALAVLLTGKAAENQSLELDVTQVDLKYGDQWVPVANRDAIAKIEALPLRLTAKGSVAMLAAPKTKVPKRKYTHLRLRFDDRNTKLVSSDRKLPLTVQATLELDEWTPDEKAVNTLTVTLDGTKVTATKSSATLPPAALTVAKTTAVAGVSGKLVPPLPTARVDVYWGNSKFVLGTAVPNAQDGSFQVGNLPAGAYRVEVTNPGYRRAETPKDLLQLSDKAVKLGEIQMVKND